MEHKFVLPHSTVTAASPGTDHRLNNQMKAPRQPMAVMPPALPPIPRGDGCVTKPRYGLDEARPNVDSRPEQQRVFAPNPGSAVAEQSLSTPLAAAPALPPPTASDVPMPGMTSPSAKEDSPAHKKRLRYATSDPERIAAGGLIDTQAAAEKIGFAPSTLRNLRCKGGGPPAIQIGRSIRYDPAELDKWLSARSVNSTSQRGDND